MEEYMDDDEFCNWITAWNRGREVDFYGSVYEETDFYDPEYAEKMAWENRQREHDRRVEDLKRQRGIEQRRLIQRKVYKLATEWVREVDAVFGYELSDEKLEDIENKAIHRFAREQGIEHYICCEGGPLGTHFPRFCIECEDWFCPMEKNLSYQCGCHWSTV